MPDLRFPSVGQAVVLTGVVLLFEVLLAAAAAAVTGDATPPPVVQAAVVLAAFAIVLWVALRVRGERPGEAFSFRPVGAALLAAVVLTVLGGTIVLSEADNLLRSLLPPPAWLEEMFAELLAGEEGVWAAIVLVAIVAPLTEELFFRGIVLRGFLARYPARQAVLWSALLFGASHLNPWQFLSAAVFGLLAGWWMARTGSLVPALFGHALNNAVPSVVSQLFHLEIPGYTGGEPGVVQFQPLWFDAVGIGLLSAGLWWTWGLLRNRETEDGSPTP